MNKQTIIGTLTLWSSSFTARATSFVSVFCRPSVFFTSRAFTSTSLSVVPSEKHAATSTVPDEAPPPVPPRRALTPPLRRRQRRRRRRRRREDKEMSTKENKENKERTIGTHTLLRGAALRCASFFAAVCGSVSASAERGVSEASAICIAPSPGLPAMERWRPTYLRGRRGRRREGASQR